MKTLDTNYDLSKSNNQAVGYITCLVQAKKFQDLGTKNNKDILLQKM